MIASWSAVKPGVVTFGFAPLSSRKPTSAVKPECAASIVALTPHASASLTLAPAATSSVAERRSPTRAANIKAVSPPCGIALL